jgi:hypothetical protein
MDSPLPEVLHLVACLRESARRGDWRNAAGLSAILPQQKMPDDREQVGEYLRALKDALIVAKASRAHAAASLGRLNAAAGFNRTRLDFAPARQNIGDLADF